MTTHRTGIAALLAALLHAVPAPAQDAGSVQAMASVQDLKRLSIEELAQIDVTTAARRLQPLASTAAAVSVITSEDIARSGYTTLPDLLRLADGLDVARVNSGTWGISARGFNTNPANKLLVLVDGRSVYSPLFSGTFWDVQDYFLSDIDRIEVIRGPGGALWGANAVNGVINVITRDAASTRGSLAMVMSGTDEHATAAARHGGRLGARGSYRVYGKYRRRGAQVFAAGGAADDPVQMGQGGVRLESAFEAPTRWFVQGDVYRGTHGFPDRPDADTSGGNLLARWSRRDAAARETQVQAYYDRSYRNIPLQFRETRDTFEIDGQHTRRLGRHQITAGGGFRLSHADDLGIGGFFFEPREATVGLFGVFVQDEIALTPERLFLTLGAKLERNDFTGLEPQPTVRIRWNGRGTQTVWGAVSRAVRLPTRFDTDLRLIDPVTRVVTLEGTRDFRAEEVVAYEAGYRVRPHARSSIDVALYTNRYDDLRSTDVTFRPNPVIVLGNRLNASTSGIEIAATAQPAQPWRLHGSVTWLTKDLRFDGGVPDAFNGTVEGNDPSHLASIRSYLDLPRGLAFDTIVRRTGRRPQPATPAHTELHLRFGWTLRPGWEISLVGQNLLQPYHPELFTGSLRFAFRRGVYLRSSWRF